MTTLLPKKRAALYLSIAGLLVMVAAVSAVSARDPSGVTLRVGMVMLTVGAAMWLPWQALLPAAIAFWFAPNYIRSVIDEEALFGTNMLLELPGMIGLAVFAGVARHSLRGFDEDTAFAGATGDELLGMDPDTGVYEERLLRPAIESELVRSRRFNREFALVLIGIDELRQRFDYRDEESWNAGFQETGRLLRSTRTHIDRAYRYGVSSFALILPEAGPRDVTGLVRRLRRVARRASPAEGEPGGPLPTHFGATFFPHCATTPDDLLRRAEIALRIAEKSSTRVQLDGAEAPEMAPPETLRADMDQPPALPALHPAVEATPLVTFDTPSEPRVVRFPSTSEAITGLVSEMTAAPIAMPLEPEPAVEPVLAEAPALAIATNGATPSSEDEEHVDDPGAFDLRAAAHQIETPPPPAGWGSPVAAPAAFVPTTVATEAPPAFVAPEPVREPVMLAPTQASTNGTNGASHEASTVAASAETTQPVSLDDSVADLLKNLDETLDLIRALRGGSAAR